MAYAIRNQVTRMRSAMNPEHLAQRLDSLMSSMNNDGPLNVTPAPLMKGLVVMFVSWLVGIICLLLGIILFVVSLLK